MSYNFSQLNSLTDVPAGELLSQGGVQAVLAFQSVCIVCTEKYVIGLSYTPLAANPLGKTLYTISLNQDERMVNACKRDANTFMLVIKISEQKTELRIFKAISGGLMNTFYVSKNILNVQAIEDTPILMVTYYERKQIKFAFDFLLQGANSAYKQIRIARTAQEQTDFLESSYF